MFNWIWRRVKGFRPESKARGRRSAATLVAPVAPLVHANDVFTPTQPRTVRTGFTGRKHEVATILQSLLEERAHVVLYSERGRGKTSLANVVVERLRRSGMTVARYRCESGSTFDTLFRGLLRSLPASHLVAPLQSEPLEGCEAALPLTPLRPEDVLTLLARIRPHALVCVVDEFDRVVDSSTRTMLADTIKQLSDSSTPILLMLIGVSENLEQLLGEHRSIQRALMALPLSLLSDENIAEIIVTGMRRSRLTFPVDLVIAVVKISRGMPYLAHLLSLRAAQSAARRESSAIDHEDFMDAVERLILQTPGHVIRQWDDLTDHGQDKAMCRALIDVANGIQDQWGHMVFEKLSSDTAMVGGKRLAWDTWLKLHDVGVLRSSVGKPGHVIIGERPLIQYTSLVDVTKDARSETRPRPRDEALVDMRPKGSMTSGTLAFARTRSAID